MKTKRSKAGRSRRLSSNAYRGRYSSTPTPYYWRTARMESSAPIRYGEEGLVAPINPYSRRVTQADYTKHRKKKKRKTAVFVVLAVVLVLMLGGAGAAFAYYQTINANLHEGIDQDLLGNLVDTQYAGAPFYMLLIGSDKSEERVASDEYAGDTFRSDSMILVRIDPEGKQVTMVSLHRDTMIDMGVNGIQKLNAAHSIGGPAYSVEVVSKMAGVDISHYAEIDFDGFKEVVDALGGVEVNVPMEINDSMAGGHVAAGLQTLNGDQALILCRSRHAYDEYGDGDRYRAANQRLVLAAIAKKILSSDPATMVTTVETLSRYVTTDFDVTSIVSLAQNLRGIDTANDIYTAMEPTESEYMDETWYEKLDTVAWKEMMRRVDQGLSPTIEDEIDPLTGTVLAGTGNGSSGSANASSTSGTSSTSNTSSTAGKRSGTVAVKNGTNVSGLGSKAADMIETLGYSAAAGNADNSDYQHTVVVYNTSNQSNAASEIAQTLGISLTLQNDGTYSFDTDFLVVIGADWA